MFLLLSLNFYLIFKYKISEAVGKFAGIVSFLVFLILSQTMSFKNNSLLMLFFLSVLVIFSLGTKIFITKKRKFHSLNLSIIPFLTFLVFLALNFSFLSKKSILINDFIATTSGSLLGLIFQALIFIPYGFNSYKEYFHFRNYTKNKNNNFTELAKCLKINITNWLTAKEFLTVVNNNSFDFSKESEKYLVSMLFFWSQQPKFNSLNPLVKKFNDMTLEQIKKELTVFDLTDDDVDLIFNIFRCGCWKPGLFIIDQYLIANKLSLKYPSVLIFSDKFLNDLKKASFDDESIENWLKNYSDIFKGSPISQKITLVYHNKDDWFNPEIRHAAL